MNRTIAIIMAVLMLLACAGCGAYGDVETPSAQPSATPAPEPAEEANIIDFSLELFALTAISEENNIVLSPLSAYLLLCLAANGAEGETLTELETALGAPCEQLNALCGKLVARLTEPAGRTTLEIANSVWVDNSSDLLDEFREQIAKDFDAEVFSVDMDTDSTLKGVNEWVSNKTHGLITSLRDKNYEAETLMTLVNAVYFNAKWLSPFSKDATIQKLFTCGNGAQVSTDFMGSYGKQRSYVKADDVEGILLPYDDGRTALLAIRPTDGRNATELAKTLTGNSLKEYIDLAQSTLMNFSMPIFSAESSVDLNSCLNAMGVQEMFSPERADFSRMCNMNGKDLFVSSLFQKAIIIVDEDGTEAAAVTGMEMSTTSIPTDTPVELHLDSPFLYTVVQLDTGLPIFLGVLNNPGK